MDEHGAAARAALRVLDDLDLAAIRYDESARRRIAVGAPHIVEQQSTDNHPENCAMPYSGNHEPPLNDVLDDPIVHLVMARDRLTREEVRVHIEAARQHLKVHDNDSQNLSARLASTLAVLATKQLQWRLSITGRVVAAMWLRSIRQRLEQIRLHPGDRPGPWSGAGQSSCRGRVGDALNRPTPSRAASRSSISSRRPS